MLIRIKGCSYSGRTSTVVNLIKDTDDIVVFSGDGDFLLKLVEAKGTDFKGSVLTLNKNDEKTNTRILEDLINSGKIDNMVLVIDIFEQIFGTKFDRSDIGRKIQDLAHGNKNTNVIIVEQDKISLNEHLGK